MWWNMLQPLARERQNEFLREANQRRLQHQLPAKTTRLVMFWKKIQLVLPGIRFPHPVEPLTDQNPSQKVAVRHWS